MESLVHEILSNAVAAGILAVAVWAFSRFCQPPALIHSFWLLVLLKLVAPPLVPVAAPLPVASLVHSREVGRPYDTAGLQATPAPTVQGQQRGLDPIREL